MNMRDEYQRRAKTCFDAACATENQQTRAALLELADEWRRMSDDWATTDSAKDNKKRS